MKFISSIFAIFFSLTASGFAQGFVNLDFEDAQIISLAGSPYYPYGIAASNALPGWTVMEDNIVCTAVWGEPVALDETSVALVYGSYSPIQGNYSVQLSAYADASSPYFRSSSISQTGFIPAGIQSIQFLIASPSNAGSVPPNPVVTINGTPITLYQMSESAGVVTMAGDVSAFANSTATLAFICEATTGGTYPANENYFNLDDIQFSPSSVPEPSIFGLFALGGLFFEPV